MGSRSMRGSSPKVPPPHLEVKREFRIKKETSDEEIKEYAETAMNEFLGWYGYDKVDSSDTQGLNLHHFAARKRGRQTPVDDDSSDGEGGCSPPPRERRPSSTPPLENESGATNGLETCCWCSKVATQKSFSLKTPGGHKFFCSELCFTQCRRANFKRNKTCDWCRHIRHTVNYVDFQDGEHQLQFCSDKCLNQYKMNIFCKETEAHLQLHPHLAETGNSKGSAGSGLITPDLWMRDCRSDSPSSERSASPPPAHLVEITKVDRKDLPVRDKNKGVRSKRVKSEISPRRCEKRNSPKPSHTFPPPLLPLNGAHLVPPAGVPPEHSLQRPPFLGYFPHPTIYPPPPPEHPIHRNGPRFPGLTKPHLISPPTPPPVIHPPPPRLIPPQMPRSLIPPVTIFVPCPIPLPIPLPIPIPIPIPLSKSFLMAHFGTKDNKEEPKPVEKDSVAEKLVESISEQNTPEGSADKEDMKESPKPPVATPPRPLRKRRRVSDLPQENDAVSKRKSVPV